MRVLPLAFAALLLASAPAAEGARATTESQPYSAAPVGASCASVGDVECPTLAASHVQFGPFSARAVDLAVDDASGVWVGASFAFYDGHGTLRGSGALCGAREGVRVPLRASFLVVEVDGPTTARHCPGLAGAGTTGTVTLRTRA